MLGCMPSPRLWYLAHWRVTPDTPIPPPPKGWVGWVWVGEGPEELRGWKGPLECQAVVLKALPSCTRLLCMP